jgi:DNA-binding response OmpR family regulator
MSRILVVDDDVNTTWLMENVFSKAGYEIHTVNNSEMAVAMALSTNPDLILLDLMMPGIDGIGICKALQAEPFTKNIPILVFSAVGDINSKLEAFSAGAKDYISKPVHIEELKSRIRIWLGQSAN